MMNVVRRIARAITNEWPLKILSLALALALWGYFITEKNPLTQEQRTVAVEAVNTPAGLITTSIQPREVQVTFQGRRRAVVAADLNEVRIIADLSSLSSQQLGETPPIALETQGLPAGVEAILSPGVARITLDQKDTIERTVTVETLGKQAEGFRLGTPRVNPTQVSIQGASSALRDVAQVVAVVDVAGFNSTVEKNIPVQLRDERSVKIAGLRTTPATVKVIVPITKVATKTVPITPRLSEPPAGYKVVSVQTSPSTVTITGVESTIAGIEYISTVRISIENLRGAGTYTPSLVFPQGVKSVGVGAATVKVATEHVTLPEPSPEPEPTEGEPTTSPGSSDSGSSSLAPDEETGTEEVPDETPPDENAEDADKEVDEGD